MKYLLDASALLPLLLDYAKSCSAWPPRWRCTRWT